MRRAAGHLWFFGLTGERNGSGGFSLYIQNTIAQEFIDERQIQILHRGDDVERTFFIIHFVIAGKAQRYKFLFLQFAINTESLHGIFIQTFYA